MFHYWRLFGIISVVLLWISACEDSASVAVQPPGDACVGVECGPNTKCVDGRCEPLEALCEADAAVCLDEVRYSLCEKGAAERIETCEDNERCEGGVCKARQPESAQIGESCELLDCVESAFCNYDLLCEAFLTLGESCEGKPDIACEGNLSCLSGRCVQQVDAGEKCEENIVCKAGMRCESGVCKTIAAEFGACNEDLVCPSLSVCVDRFCAPTKGDCESDADCSGDSYCCTQETCASVVNVCVPYSSEKPNDETCIFESKEGIFEAAVQCHWRDVQANPEDEISGSMSTPLVGRFGNKVEWTKPLIATLTFGKDRSITAIRIIHPETCELLETIAIDNDSYNNLAAADFNGDGLLEIVSFRVGSGPVIFAWSKEEQKHVITHEANNLGATTLAHGTYSIHDIDDDGLPEIISTFGDVYTHEAEFVARGAGGNAYSGSNLANLDQKGGAELVTATKVLSWNLETKKWDLRYDLPNVAGSQAGFADFGRPGDSPEAFDFNTLDGWPEVVTIGDHVNIWAVLDDQGQDLPAPQLVMTEKRIASRGYPVAIGDINGDGFPDIAVSGKGPATAPKEGQITALSPLCLEAVQGRCRAKNIMWEHTIQDASGVAGTSLFDFDGDKKAEVVYGDECYTRVFDGTTGEILFSSSRNSGTVVEYPTIADVDDDGSAEIVVASDKYNLGCPAIDPIHKGVMCTEDSDCYSGMCRGGLCRCKDKVNAEDRDDCNSQTVNGKLFVQYQCSNPIDGSLEQGKVCRAAHTEIRPGITVLRDRLDRWVAARPLWNQHAYSVTNINDDGSIPKLSDWKANWLIKTLNNFRQNSLGIDGRAGLAPDITGRFTSAADVCKLDDSQKITINAQVCNRGTKAVGARMPAVFYVDNIANENILCVSYTNENVPVKGCRPVACEISYERAASLAGKKIILHVNDDGKGGKTTIECNEKNNVDEIVIAVCLPN